SAANAAALATQFKGGAPVASNPAETLDVEKINQLVDQKINGAKKITLESVQLGSYQLTEIINVGRKMKPAQTQGKSQGEAVTIDGHSAKIEVDENGTIK